MFENLIKLNTVPMRKSTHTAKPFCALLIY